MKKKMMMVLSVVMLVSGWTVAALASDLISLQDNLYIKSIDAMRINENPVSTLRILATFRNDNDKTIRIKNAKYMLSVNPGNENFEDIKLDGRSVLGSEAKLMPNRKLDIGIARISELMIEPQQELKAVLEIPMPQAEKTKNLLLTRLVNYIGTPAASKKMGMAGDGNVGVKGQRGWASQDLTLELYYVPKLQREVLFD